MDIQSPVQIKRNAVGPLTLSLTERESEVSALIARGFTNPEIASHLGISATTVRTHVDNIFTKLGVHRRVQIAQLYWLSHSA
jgi:DNA-binding NarL/FixJ family response regulator